MGAMVDAEDTYRQTLDHLLEGFQLLGPDWKYIYVNPAAATQGRTTPEALIGRSILEAYPGIEQSPLFAAMRRCMEEREPAAFENLFPFADGTARWFELRMEPVPDGICVHSIDIDDRKTAEKKLRALNEDLERSIEERTRELRFANQELEAFSFSVSHDLRAPLRAIDGFSAALEEDCGEELGEGGRAHLARIRRATERMRCLIEDLLSLSRVGKAPLLRREVDLSALARSVARTLEEGSPGRRVVWDFAPDLRASCDPGLARVLLENLLANAFKFTARREIAHIVFKAAASPGSFTIADDGEGFDMAFVSKLFAPFQRLHDARAFPGNGIGLTIVMRIVSRHGGALEASGKPGEGAAFTFSLGGVLLGCGP